MRFCSPLGIVYNAYDQLRQYFLHPRPMDWIDVRPTQLSLIMLLNSRYDSFKLRLVLYYFERQVGESRELALDLIEEARA